MSKAMAPSQQDIEKLLSDRLEEVRRERVALKERIEGLDSRFKEAKRLAGIPPKETESDIQQQITQLERQYTTTSQSKVEERKFLYEIDKLKQKKKSASNYNKYGGEIELLRNQLTVSRSELLEKETAIDELSSGLRKVKLATRAGCNSSELIETNFEVDVTKIPQIVGRGGMNIRSLEGDYGVSVDVDHIKGGVRVTGTPSAIEKARHAISIIMDTVSEEFLTSYETITCLMMDKLHILNELQSKYDVRIDVNQSKGLCKIVGLSKMVEQAKKDITTIPSGRYDVKVDKSFFPSIIGKGGANVRSIAAEHKVVINVNRDDDTIEVVGFKVDVLEVVKKIRDVVDENREVEEAIQLDKHILLGCLVATTAVNIRAIAKEHNVRIETEGAKEDKIHTIKIKGINSKVQPTKAHLLALIQTYKNDSTTLEVADEIIPAVLGKGGLGIKAMREKYSDANIDFDGTIIHIHSRLPNVRNQIVDEINAIVGENYMESLETCEDFGIMLKTARAAEVRDALSHTLNVKMSIEKNNCLVKLKGSRINVKKALDMLRLLQNDYVVQTICIPEEDYPILLKSGDESLVRTLTEKFHVDITANRKDLNFSIRGKPSQVQSVVEYINGFLTGDYKYGSQILKLDNMISPSFIGKSGAHVKKLEEELEVKFDLLKSRGLLRIRGDGDKVRHAKVVVTKFLLNSRISENISLPNPVSKERFEEISRKLSDLYMAELEQTTEGGSEVSLRSSYQVLPEVKQFLKELCSGEGFFLLPLLEKHIATLKSTPDFGLGKFKNKFGLDLSNEGIKIQGDSVKLSAAKREFMRSVHILFPQETAFIEISRACMRDIVNAELLIAMENLKATIQCDRSVGFLWLVCPAENLHAAQIAVETQLSPWKAHNSAIRIEDFMIPLLLGKGGVVINGLRKELNCSIEIDRVALAVDIKASSPDLLLAAVTALQAKIDKMRTEHWETKIRIDLVPLLIGKQGANINKFRTETGVQIDIDHRLGVVKLNGAEDKIPEARRRLMEFIEEEEKYRSLPKSFHLPLVAIPSLIGPKGATIKELQEKSGAKIDIDRLTKKCTLRGKNEDCEKAFNAINEILELEGCKPISRIEDKVEVEDTLSRSSNESDNEEKVNTATNDTSRTNLSKSAMKRLRKKERQTPIVIPQTESIVISDTNEIVKATETLEVSEPVHEEAVVHHVTVAANDVPSVILPPLSISDPIIDVLQMGSNTNPGVIGQQNLSSVGFPTPSSAPQHLVNFLLGKDAPTGFNLPHSTTPSSTSTQFTTDMFGSNSRPSRLPFANQYFPTAPSIHDVMFAAPVFGVGSKSLNVPPPGLSPSTATAKPNPFSFGTTGRGNNVGYKNDL